MIQLTDVSYNLKRAATVFTTSRQYVAWLMTWRYNLKRAATVFAT